MNVTVIIPIHEYNEKVESYLNKALESISKQEGVNEIPKILFVAPIDVCEKLDEVFKDKDKEYSLVNSTNDSSYQAQVNLGVEHITTDYFSVLEFDDEYSTTYFKNVVKYIESYPEIDVFLTMMIEVNDNNEGIKLTNETVWSPQFVGENGEIGYLNINALKQYTDFKLSGAIIKKSEFVNIGKYKTNIKLTFMYEFMLRALNNACKIFSIPKIGYKHLATREDSLFDIYQKTMSINERKFWFETATTESNFINDRTIDMSRLHKQIVE